MSVTSATCSRPAAAWHGLCRPAMLFGVLLALAGWWRSDQLPAPETLLPEAIVEPIEAAVREPEFHRTVGGYEYIVRPRYSYEISGLVASLHHSDAWWDMDHRDAHDKLNIADLCMVWGQNASSGIYRRLRFSNTQWTCHVEYRTSEDGNAFIRTQMSNNHVLADSPEVERELMAIRVGEQVRLRGWLVDYAALDHGRIFSVRNTSHGHNGENCEVLYVTSVEQLRSAPHTIWRLLVWLGVALTAMSALGWMLLPPTYRDT
jgi:hypothetical protein